MWGRRIGIVFGIVAVAMATVAGSAWAGGPGMWTKLATVDNSFDTFGMLRTADQNLHLVWLAKRAGDTTHSYSTATVSVAGKVLAKGTAISGWGTLAPDPRLVPAAGGIRLIFNGNTGSTGCHALASIFTATSANGSSWSLASGSMDHDTFGTGNIAATVKSDLTTPVAVFAAGHLFHVGVDPSCPAVSPDGTVTPTTGASQNNPSAVTDRKTGAVYVAWFQGFQKWGYWVERILPTQGSPVPAPHGASYNTTKSFQNNQPDEPVALAARVGGGVYMAYCVANATEPCVHIDLWKVGTSQVMVVPGSQHVYAARVAIAADTLGNMSVAWFNGANGKAVIHEVRTNPAATAWGTVRTISAPAHTFGLSDLQAEGSSARVDLLVTDQLGTPGLPIDLFQTQVLPGMLVTATPGSFSHKASKTVLFKVTDAGQPLAGAIVSCLGKSGTTNSAGKVKLTFKKGEPTGTHHCTAAKAFYAVSSFTIKVT